MKNMVIDCILYVPKGLLCPIADALALAKTRLNQDKIYCLSHQPAQIKPKPLRPKRHNIADGLHRYRNQIVWFGLMPVLILSAAIASFGIGILSPLYLFYVSSYWSGKLLSHLSNIIVLGKKAPEWIFLRTLSKVVKQKMSVAQFYRNYRDDFIENAKWLFLHIAPLILFGQLSKFVAWCFCEFISWLSMYVVLKRVAEQAPARLHKFEKYLKKSDKASNKLYRRHLSNLCWLVSYDLFQRTASRQAQECFKKYHLQSHTHQSANKMT